MPGSVTGALGTVVSPAPRRCPRSRVEVEPTRRVIRLPGVLVRAEPSADDASRLELVRVEVRWAAPLAGTAAEPAPVDASAVAAESGPAAEALADAATLSALAVAVAGSGAGEPQ
ncbi:hypothetical protein GCM10025865_00640 [Paraoerskovia sediminicola]|uniref:Uncharacterized protein n=1 Tax=Paraoerskovia sediminicola TaxID=1138587 RepID=A0ABN6X7J3_9CELL|nr:hypothetical protein GCM10025865_00640 [Paraoerskovia sediminicola]